MTDKKQLTKEAELRFAAEFVRLGWNVFLPYGDDSPVDLLIQKGKEYRRIQIKATKPINGAIICRLKSANNWQVKKYSKDNIDSFGIYDYENKKGYLLPIEEVEGLTEPCLRLEKTKNNQLKGIRLAKNYHYFD